MLANAKILPVTKDVKIKSPANLTVVEKPRRLSQEQALVEMRGRLKDKNNPSYVYNQVLTTSQRKVLCFSAQLSRTDLELSFEQLSADARMKIQKALVLLRSLYGAFDDARSLDLKLFV
ncbi:MAG: hypothetical protein HRT53_20775 [Colwellia sp.]|nr:hypothetical protein [Colwellia sp.]